MLLHSDDVDTSVIKQINGFHLVSGIYDLRALVPTSVNDNMKLTKTTADASSPLRIRKIRKEFQDKASEIWVSVTVGKYDSSLFQQQSKDYYKLLKKTFTHSEFWKSETDDHFSLVENMQKNNTEAGKQFEHFVHQVSGNGVK
jgi:hypothetical protein